MAEITPRWEWRSFGQRFGEAEGRLAQLDPNGVQESDEIYLLSGAGDNVKVRDALMDIKVLREVNADGLEQWTPVMKAEFPLSAATAAEVLAALRLPVDGKVYEVQFDDWMFLVDQRVMLNKAVMSKFGVRLGEVTLSFYKNPAPR